MARLPDSIALSIHPTEPQRIQIRDDEGKIVGTWDIPMNYRLAVVRSPWWVRLKYWARLQVWRAKGAWGQE